MSQTEYVQYTLALVTRMLSDDKTRASHFLTVEKKKDDDDQGLGGGGGEAYALFLRLLAAPDWFTREKAMFCLTRLIDQRPARDKGLRFSEDGEPATPASVAAVDCRVGCARSPADPPPHRAGPVVSPHRVAPSIREVRPVATRACAPTPAPAAAGPHAAGAVEAGLCAWLLVPPAACDAMARGDRGLMEVAGAAAEKVVRVRRSR